MYRHLAIDRSHFQTTTTARAISGLFYWEGHMVDFNNETRKRCRHCKMKLPEPTSNERQAFCTRGCYQSFYLHRRIVCEKAIERTTANRKICKKSRCRNALKAGEGFGRYHADSAQTTRASKNRGLMVLLQVLARSTIGFFERHWGLLAPRPYLDEKISITET
jgi:hypothetical protein